MGFCHAMRINDIGTTLDFDLHPRIAARYSRENARVLIERLMQRDTNLYGGYGPYFFNDRLA